VPAWLILLIVLDAVITAVVIFWIVRRQGTIGGMLGKTVTEFRALAAFTNERHARIGEYMRANWSGAPEQLPQVLQALLDQLEREAHEHNLRIDREALKTLLSRSLQMHQIGHGAEVRKAIARVA
jgi:hypothetical protein